ncbi:hypothetical protein OHQ89_12720 [Streptomyces canus]|uniref:hypothetical protein n=1 Tax=Streptomyces canus TaxID=58343 RepID=UPI0030E4350A
MTTATETLPAHGTPSRARGRYHKGVKRCPCKPCREAERRYNKHRRYLTATGQALTTDAAPVTQHLRDLFAAGAGWHQTATAADCSLGTLSKLLKGEQTRMRRSLAVRILAVRLEQVVHQRAAEPAIGSIRRVRALMAVGHACTTIRQITGLDRTVVSQLVNAQTDSILTDTADKVRAAYEQLSSQTGPSVRNKSRAARQGWRDPQWWEDYGRIDDPDFDPATVDRELNFLERAQLRREEIEHLAWCGHEPEQIRERLNGEVSISTIRQIVAEWRTGQKRDRKQVAA